MHWKSNIADFDRVLVMNEGHVVEFGTPEELMNIQGCEFWELVNQSGERVLLEEIVSGKRSR